MDDRSLIGLGALIYLGGFLFASAYLIKSRRYERWVLYPVLLVGFIIQTYGLYLRGMETGGCPLGNLFEISQFIAWSIVLLYLVIGPPFRLSFLGFFSAGLATVLALTSWLIPAWDATTRTHAFPSPWIELHAASAIFSYGVLGILAATSTMFLIQNRALRKHRSRGMVAFLPSIRDLEWINRRLLLVATLVLSFSLVLGSFYWWPNPDSVNWSKLAFTLAMWGLCIGVLFLHYRGNLLSRNFAACGVGLFLFALVTLIPVDSSRKQSSDSPSGPPPLEGRSHE